jgi:hemerythrin superfamily protein
MPNPLETVAAKTAAKAANVGARAKGLTGVFAKLAEQHQEVSVLLKRAAGVDDVQKRRELWATLRRELLSHERGERQVVYPALEDLEDLANLQDIVQRHAEEADTLEAAIIEIDIAGCSSPNWPSHMQRLIALVQKHVDEEEDDFFPRAQEALGKDVARDLEDPFMAAKERQMESIQ